MNSWYCLSDAEKKCFVVTKKKCRCKMVLFSIGCSYIYCCLRSCCCCCSLLLLAYTLFIIIAIQTHTTTTRTFYIHQVSHLSKPWHIWKQHHNRYCGYTLLLGEISFLSLSLPFLFFFFFLFIIFSSLVSFFIVVPFQQCLLLSKVSSSNILCGTILTATFHSLTTTVYSLVQTTFQVARRHCFEMHHCRHQSLVAIWPWSLMPLQWHFNTHFTRGHFYISHWRSTQKTT